MIVPIKNMDSGAVLYFQSRTVYEAMNKLKFYLSIKDNDASKLVINKSPLNNFLYLVYKGETYCAKMGCTKK